MIYVHVGFNRFIPGPYVDGYHKTIGTFIMSICYATFAMASWTSPGLVTPGNANKCVKRY